MDVRCACCRLHPPSCKGRREQLTAQDGTTHGGHIPCRGVDASGTGDVLVLAHIRSTPNIICKDSRCFISHIKVPEIHWVIWDNTVLIIWLPVTGAAQMEWLNEVLLKHIREALAGHCLQDITKKLECCIGVYGSR